MVVLVEVGDRDEPWYPRFEDDSEGEGSDSADWWAVRPEHDQVGELSEEPPGPDLEPARLRVAAVGGGEVLVGGLLSPSWLVHATGSENVVVGDHCTLETTEHHHFDRIAVSLDDVLGDRRVREALGDLVREGFTPALDRAFRRALRRTLIDNGAEPEELDLPLASRPAHVTSRSGVVQVGDGSHLETETPVYVRELVLPGGELLARDGSLRRAFVAALRAPERDGPETARFLRDLISAAGCGDQLRLLDYAAAQGHHDASVFSLFGFTQVSNAGAVLAGAGNTFIRGVEVEVGQFRGEDLGRTISRLRKRFPAPQVPVPGIVPTPETSHLLPPGIRRIVTPIEMPEPTPPTSPVRHDEPEVWLSQDRGPDRPDKYGGPSLDL